MHDGKAPACCLLRLGWWPQSGQHPVDAEVPLETLPSQHHSQPPVLLVHCLRYFLQWKHNNRHPSLTDWRRYPRFIKTGHERNPEGGVTISRHDQGRSGGSGSSVHQGQQGLGSHPPASDSVKWQREPHLAGHGQAQSFSFLEATPSPPGQDPEQEQESVFIVCIYWSQTFSSANTEHCLAGMVCVVPTASVYKHLYCLQHTSIQ